MPQDMEPYENRLSLDELRREVRNLLDTEKALKKDILELPEVASSSTLLLLSHGGFLPFWEIGVTYQRSLPYGSVPHKTECEIGAGRWKVIREALLAAQRHAPQRQPSHPEDHSHGS